MKLLFVAIGLAALVAVGVWAMRAAADDSGGAAIYADLRSRALSITPSVLQLRPASETSAYGVIMEMDVDGETATLVAFASGDASLYLSTGGGVIGGGQHEAVRASVSALMVEADQATTLLHRTQKTPRPARGQTRFYVLTEAGILAAERPEQALGEQRDPLSPLFFAGQSVLTELRLTSGG